ncbi:MAG: DNA cytosine methyltransferase [Gammaproteobacteria bacterium]|nr:DNA cytosine methyltransferase [Gammaproteobacteria bacterium]
MHRALDLFCGAGGSSAGARAAGFEIAGAVDMWPIATETFRFNFPQAHVVTERLERIPVRTLRRRIGEIDLLLASPECTSHTCAKGSAPRSEASRATALHVVAYAEAFRPRWLVLENVVHMRPWPGYQTLIGKLRELGYHLAEQVLEASDFGVPQSRRRLFVVGDLRRPPRQVHHRPCRRKPTVKSILDSPGSWPTSLLFKPNRAAETLKRARRAMETLGAKSSFLLVYYGTDGSGGWQTLDRPLRTITTVDRFALVEHSGRSWTMRMLQVPELMRAMGLDESFVLPCGTRRERVHLLGNGVCPPVMETILRTLTAE